jgi:hypothetical protein
MILAGCSAPAPTPAAPTPEDREFLQERIRAAIESPYVQGRYYAEYETGGKVVMSCRGTVRGFRMGVVLIEEESESGAPLQLLRVGNRSWIFKEGWQDTAGTPNASGNGFQSLRSLAALDLAEEKFLPHGRAAWSAGVHASMLGA